MIREYLYRTSTGRLDVVRVDTETTNEGYEDAQAVALTNLAPGSLVAMWEVTGANETAYFRQVFPPWHDDSLITQTRWLDHPEDCPACLRGRYHTLSEHGAAIDRAYEGGAPC